MCHSNLVAPCIYRVVKEMYVKYWPRGYKTFFKLSSAEIVEISGKFRFSTQQLVIYPAHVKMPTIVGILTFMSRINFSLS